MATQNVPKSTPKDVFLHLLSIVTLYASVVSFMALLWQCINVWFPSPLGYYYTSVLNSVRWSASVLVVMYPVYVFVIWLINRDFTQNPERREIKVRKWLVYLTLFISAVTVIIDVITLVYNLFGGELTMSFVLKVLVVLITAAAVFAYYLWDLRKDGFKQNLKILAWGVSIVVLAAIIGGFVLVGSPSHQRKVNFDTQRENDLSQIQSNILNYYQQKGVLPTDLQSMVDNISVGTIPVDPESHAAYEYSTQGPQTFTLCATFNLPSVSDTTLRTAPIYPAGDLYNSSWVHKDGHTCYTRAIDPQRYKNPQPIPVK